jgi:hypothetical protein
MKANRVDAVEYEIMMREQNRVCAICKEKNYDGQDLFIDHDHDTGEVRGLLCGRCNSGLGFFRDRVRLLAEAIVYLESHGKSYYW